eukprot:scaffold220604_cov17-Tisochrysis_lutea.AAC.1
MRNACKVPIEALHAAGKQVPCSPSQQAAGWVITSPDKIGVNWKSLDGTCELVVLGQDRLVRKG